MKKKQNKNKKRIIYLIVVVTVILATPAVYFGLLRFFSSAVEYSLPVWQSNLIKKSPDTQTGAVHVPILIYHHISRPPFYIAKEGKFLYVRPEVFAEQMKYLKENDYNVISYSQFYQALTRGSSLPAKPVVITFDDGNYDQYQNAIPILQQYNYPAMFFVFTKAVGGLGSMTWAMLHNLLAAGMEIGSHALSHSRLSALSTEQADFELARSKQLLENNLFVDIHHFAYPYGTYDTSTVEAVINTGYESAVVASGGGWHERQQGNFLISRIIATEDMEYFKWLLEN